MGTNTISINKLANTRVLLLGGTSGFGFAVARVAVEHGASIIVASSKETKPETSPRITGFTCDLADELTVETNVVTLFQKSTSRDTFSPSIDDGPEDQIIPLDHIVFTAGDFLAVKPPTNPAVDVRLIHTFGAVRFMGSAMVAKHAPTYMRVAPSSSITLTSGSTTARPLPGWSFGTAYGTAVEGLARGLAVDLAPIRVNAIAPGVVHTEIFDSVAGDNVEVFVEMMARDSLVGEVGKPEDVAETYLAMIKDRFITGTLARSDEGGL